MDAIISHLNGYSADALAPADLALMFMEVAPAVEIYKQPDVSWGKSPCATSTRWTACGTAAGAGGMLRH